MTTIGTQIQLQRKMDELLSYFSRLSYPYTIDEFDLKNGKPSAYLPFIHFLMLNNSKILGEYIIGLGYNLTNKSDYVFVETIFKILRVHFNYKPEMTLAQFFYNGHTDKKISLIFDLIRLTLQKHRELKSRISASINDSRKQMREYKVVNHEQGVSNEYSISKQKLREGKDQHTKLTKSINLNKTFSTPQSVTQNKYPHLDSSHYSNIKDSTNKTQIQIQIQKQKDYEPLNKSMDVGLNRSMEKFMEMEKEIDYKRNIMREINQFTNSKYSPNPKSYSPLRYSPNLNDSYLKELDQINTQDIQMKNQRTTTQITSSNINNNTSINPTPTKNNPTHKNKEEVKDKFLQEYQKEKEILRSKSKSKPTTATEHIYSDEYKSPILREDKDPSVKNLENKVNSNYYELKNLFHTLLQDFQKLEKRFGDYSNESEKQIKELRGENAILKNRVEFLEKEIPKGITGLKGELGLDKKDTNFSPLKGTSEMIEYASPIKYNQRIDTQESNTVDSVIYRQLSNKKYDLDKSQNDSFIRQSSYKSPQKISEQYLPPKRSEAKSYLTESQKRVKFKDEEDLNLKQDENYKIHPTSPSYYPLFNRESSPNDTYSETKNEIERPYSYSHFHEYDIHTLSGKKESKIPTPKKELPTDPMADTYQKKLLEAKETFYRISPLKTDYFTSHFGENHNSSFNYPEDKNLNDTVKNISQHLHSEGTNDSYVDTDKFIERITSSYKQTKDILNSLKI